MGKKDDEFTLGQFEAAARWYPVGNYIFRYEAPQGNVKRDRPLGESVCRCLRSRECTLSPRESGQRAIREEHPYLRPPKGSPDACWNLRPGTPLLVVLPRAWVGVGGAPANGRDCKGDLRVIKSWVSAWRGFPVSSHFSCWLLWGRS